MADSYEQAMRICEQLLMNVIVFLKPKTCLKKTTLGFDSSSFPQKIWRRLPIITNIDKIHMNKNCKKFPAKASKISSDWL